MKQVPRISPAQAAALVKTGDTILVGGFGMTGNPTQVLHALAETDTGDLTYIANNVGEPGLGGGRLRVGEEKQKGLARIAPLERRQRAQGTVLHHTSQPIHRLGRIGQQPP